MIEWSCSDQKLETPQFETKIPRLIRAKRQIHNSTKKINSNFNDKSPISLHRFTRSLSINGDILDKTTPFLEASKNTNPLNVTKRVQSTDICEPRPPEYTCNPRKPAQIKLAPIKHDDASIVQGSNNIKKSHMLSKPPYRTRSIKEPSTEVKCETKKVVKNNLLLSHSKSFDQKEPSAKNSVYTNNALPSLCRWFFYGSGSIWWL